MLAPPQDRGDAENAGAERSSARVRLQDAKAFVAASTARRRPSPFPRGKRPMIWRKSQGLTDSKCFAAPSALTADSVQPWRGRRFSIFASAARKAFLWASTEKSVSGSLWNSGSKVTSERRNLSKPET